MFKKLLCTVLAVLIAVMPLHSQAADLAGTFNNLMASGSTVGVNSPGAFSSQARAGFTAGGIEARIPRTSGSPSLLSVSAPKIQAGCNGISAHFGGFSFISAEAFTDLLKKIASGAALGFVTSLVMKTLCPPCEQIVQDLKTSAAEASKFARNSCQWGQEQGREFRKGLQESLDASQMCATTVSEDNQGTDSLAAWAGLCSTREKAVAAVREKNGLPAGGGTSAQDQQRSSTLDCQMGGGNLTWKRLGAFDTGSLSDTETYKRKLLLLNILGAVIAPAGKDEVVSCEYKSGPGVSTATQSGGGENGYCLPQADTKMLSSLFLCGAPNAAGVLAENASPRVRDYCIAAAGGPIVAAATFKVWTCDEPVNCRTMRLTNPSAVISGEGFLVTVNKMLLDAVDRVRTNRGFEDAEGVKILQLIQVAPYPLYQAVNAAAVYPAAAQDLLDSMSILVAEQYAYALLDETLTVTSKVGTNVCPMSQAQSSNLLDFINGFRQENKARMQQMGQNMVAQQALTRQILEINNAIQQQVLTEDMLATGRMAENINNAITVKGKKQ